MEETAITVGTPDDFETLPFATSTTACDPAKGRIGSIALVPRSQENARVAVRVVTGLSKSAAQCVRDGYEGGCVVARRILHYVPHRGIDIPIEMQGSCRDIACSATQTCRNGTCVPALIEDPRQCAHPGGCEMSTAGRGGEGGGGEQTNGGGGQTNGGQPNVGEAGDDGTTQAGEAGAAGSPTTCSLPCPAEAPVCDEGECRPPPCDLSGAFALKLNVSAAWKGGTYIQSGTGNFQFWMKLTGTHVGDQIRGELTDCGRLGPALKSATVNETYRLAYPDSLFDSTPPLLQPIPVMLSLDQNTRSLTAPPVAVLMGTSLTDPVEDTWPESASDLARVDTDKDEKPGITVNYRNDSGYDYPHAGPVSPTLVEKMYLASRVVFSLDGELTSCVSSSGEATVKSLDTRVFGCKLLGSGPGPGPSGECSSTEAEFLDSNVILSEALSATYELVKIDDDATCAEIRSSE